MNERTPEQIQALNNLYEQFGGQASTISTNVPQEDILSKELKSAISGAQGLISSAESDMGTLIKNAIDTLKAGGEAGRAATESRYGRLIGKEEEKLQTTLTSAQEAQRGFATNTGLLKQIRKEGEESIKLLEQQRQELINSGFAAEAQAVANLQFQQAQMTLQQRNQVFNNLIGLASLEISQAGFGLQKKQFAQAQKEFDFNMESKLGDIALTYGLDLKDDDTIESVVTRASGRAKSLFDEKLAELRLGSELKRAQIAAEKAKLADIETKLTETDLMNMVKGIQIYGGQDSFYAQTIYKTLAEKGNLEALNRIAVESAKTRTWKTEEIISYVKQLQASGADFKTALGDIRINSALGNKDKAEDVLRTIYREWPQTSWLSDYIQQYKQSIQTWGNVIDKANPFN